MRKDSLAEAREHVLRIIHLCGEVERKGYNPFEVDVKEELDYLRRLLPSWRKPSDLILDGEALRGLSRVVELQDEWVKERSRLRILDPETVKERIGEASIPQLASLFFKVWKPIVRLETLTRERLEEAASYWVKLKPRSFKQPKESPIPGREEASAETIRALGLSLGVDFRKLMEEVFLEFKARAERLGGEISYWDFVRAQSFRETVVRAYVVSFLATYGYVQLSQDRLTGELRLKPSLEAGKPGEGFSLAIPIDRDVVGLG